MPKQGNKNLTKEELGILYYFVKNKLMFNAHRASLHHFLPEFNGIIYDTEDMIAILGNLVTAGYLKTTSRMIGTKKNLIGITHEEIEFEYGIKDKSTYEELYKRFRLQIYSDKIVSSLIRLCNFLLKHIITIIVSFITSLLTTYIGLQLFGK